MGWWDGTKISQSQSGSDTNTPGKKVSKQTTRHETYSPRGLVNELGDAALYACTMVSTGAVVKCEGNSARERSMRTFIFHCIPVPQLPHSLRGQA